MQIAPVVAPDHMAPRFIGLATVFYITLFSAAIVLNTLRGQDVFVLGDSALFGLSAGVFTACGTVALNVLSYRFVPTLRRLSDRIAQRLVVEETKKRDLVLLSVLSGVAEEAFFRGALQPVLGLVATSLLFGATHLLPDRRYFVWTLWAIGAGFLFGFLYEWTGGLLAPITAHVLHNAATLLLWKRSRRKRLYTPGEATSEEGAAARREG